MKNTWLLFVLGAIASWGAYVPTIHHGQMGFGTPKGPFRAFLFVGVAYFLVAVVVPLILIYGMKSEPGALPAAGVRISTLAGVFGAIGAPCVIFALKSGGDPRYVAPLVFAGAPLMSVIVSMFWDWKFSMPDWRFIVGILMAACGAALVLRYKPV